jgi:predicted aminopeptidase
LAQAARGQWDVLHGAKPIDDVIRQSTAAGVSRKLKLVGELREFAGRELRLPVDGQYERYRDLERPFVVWVVFAAPEFSVEAKTWWYPLVGPLKYRGFFAEDDARREADVLRKQGYDVYVGGVGAYSTLGWFKDPVLNTFLLRSDAELAELLFHELTHQRLYLSGDTDFNEAFATAVGQEGARRWLRANGRTAELRLYELEQRREREFVAVVLAARERLKVIYETNRGEAPDRLRERKRAAFAHLKEIADALEAHWDGTADLDPWFSEPVNNARLNTLATYYDLLPGFEQMLAEEGHDLERFYRRVEKMRSMSRKERRETLLNAGTRQPPPGRTSRTPKVNRELNPAWTPSPSSKPDGLLGGQGFRQTKPEP